MARPASGGALVRAVQLVEWGSDPVLREVEVPRPAAGDVLVKVGGAGLCHSDLDIMTWPAGTMPWRLPFTLGHESAGTVAALGPAASGVAVGDRVLVYLLWGCGTCRHCLEGAENRCLRQWEGRGGGLGLDGGVADYLLVPSARLLVPIDGLDVAAAAPLADAALTPYHALRSHLPLRPGSSVVVLGVGGLGHIAVQLLLALTPARVIAVDLRENARELALAAGAHAALDANGLDASALRSETGPEGAALVLDFVGVDTTLELAAATVEIGGHVTIVGRGGGTFPTASPALPFEWSASRISGGTLPELLEVVELARSGAIRIEVERFSLDDALEGYRRLRDGEVVGRAVVVP
jgi:alcohol dehydrogenase, propanol-preferring